MHRRGQDGVNKMPRRHGHLRALGDLKTHSRRSAAPIAPHSAYMKITSLELEKLRLARVRDNAAQRISDIDARCAEIERQKAALLRALGNGATEAPAAAPARAHGPLSRAAGARSFRY